MGGGGRKNLKRAVGDNNDLSLLPGQSIMQVLSLRGSNLIEVTDSKGEKSLALFPAKFQKSMWIKRGNYVVVDGSFREEALESGSKVASIVCQVLFHEQVRRLQKTPEWPEAFKSQDNVRSTKDLQDNDRSTKDRHQPSSELEEETGTSDDDDDGLPPLESNMNRVRPYEESDSESD